jgi:hypothetical protein
VTDESGRSGPILKGDHPRAIDRHIDYFGDRAADDFGDRVAPSAGPPDRRARPGDEHREPRGR